MPLLLHLVTHARHQLLRNLIVPILHRIDDGIEKDRLGLDIFLARVAREEGDGRDLVSVRSCA